ncbi:hypothetical protein VCUG_00028 [Vavraia culicis subsp. floridensis]|uniref:Dynein light chain n=1 Tax=Vavraia culicis (isolate floridensis) TaxID=948595 RepID=L2GXS6_VAVCU|nr:uncharacterized protein VCUG_00028 [Vavraia culicis subsp. floridensis]ELA48419.1 hypothetical protein VCUG_00028 [Vavraia culicis subsp. floridensis]
MATKVEEKETKAPEEEEKKKHLAKVVKSTCDQNVLDHCLDIIDRYKIKDSSPTFCKRLKDSLDSNFNKEWNVFIGGHFSGMCGFVENTYMELMLNDNMRMVIFQSYSPDKR